MGELVFAALTPHPPLLIPDVGGRHTEEVKKTTRAMEELMGILAEREPETVVLISPHGPVFQDAVGLLRADTLEGDFSQFGAEHVRLRFTADVEFLASLESGLREKGIRTQMVGSGGGDFEPNLDYASLVPLYFIARAGFQPKLVSVGMAFMPFDRLLSFGQALAAAIRDSDRRVAVIASGDLSHRLTPGAPAGYHPEAKEFDRRLLELLSARQFRAVVELNEDLIEKAGECGLRPLIMMLGVLLDKWVQVKVLSYEGPFGVGYAVVSFAPESAPVKLAREAIETYLTAGRTMDPPAGLPAELAGRRASFVSLKARGELRGCIGTVFPCEENAALEVIRNAVLAATEDPRFSPVQASEVPELTISVDLLNPPEKVSSMEELDPEKFGVIVRYGGRTGVLLPDLEGIDSASEQVSIACRKAGIRPDEPFTIERFTVTRYH